MPSPLAVSQDTRPRAAARSCGAAAALAVATAWLLLAPAAHAQFTRVETRDLRLVYLDPVHTYLTPHIGRCYESALGFHRRLFNYEPRERKLTVFVTDFSDSGNASATAIPRDLVTLHIAPLSFDLETFTANERMNYLMNHELAHVVNMDQAAGRDLVFRRLFHGKVAPVAQHPESMLWFYLTTPRVASPRWYLEGMAVFLDTWMAGGLGRTQGPYDEMVFRSMVKDGSRFYDPLGLASELTKTDFRLESNSYLYGGRFASYLAYQYGPESLVRWTRRTAGSRAYFASQFELAYGKPLGQAWHEWIDFERRFQQENLDRIRKYPVTPYRDVSPRALGSVSRAFVDPETRQIYAGLNYPGTVGHLAAISLDDGRVTKLRDIKRPRVYSVTSLAWDPESRMLFYTADNAAWRDLMALDPRTRRERMLLKDARIGELAFDRADRSLWGVRTLNGICTLVRVPHPYAQWTQVRSWPYGEVLYDVDVSPDGALLSMAVGSIEGKQTIRVMKTALLLAGDTTEVARFDFGSAVPSTFRFTPDGRFLIGTSYYSGVSNVFRYEIATGKLEALTNTDTGFFRPVPLEGDRLLVFRYTGEGFVPAIVDAKPVEDVNPIVFLGAQMAEKHPIVKQWIAPSPASVPIESMFGAPARYSPLASLRLESVFPVLQGYKDTAGFGLHARFSDPLQFNVATLTGSFTPGSSIRGSERLHLMADYQRYAWKAKLQYNPADFYDLFGPTKVSRKGWALGGGWHRTLVYDVPRQLDLNLDATYHGALETLPDFQNVAAPIDRLLVTRARLSWQNVRNSLGSVDDEKGERAEVVLGDDHAAGTSHLRGWARLDGGVALPWGHSSLWLRNVAGVSTGRRNDPLSSIYFGGFGNNWVDRGEEKRYREVYSFPGLEINEASGRSFARSLLELNLPPVHFRRLGTPAFYATWLRPAVFASLLLTDPASPEWRRRLGNAGAQLDLRFTVLSQLEMTLSAGHAVAFESGAGRRHETMVSLKVLR